MNIFNPYRRKARIVYDVIDYNLFCDAETAQTERRRWPTHSLCCEGTGESLDFLGDGLE